MCHFAASMKVSFISIFAEQRTLDIAHSSLQKPKQSSSKSGRSFLKRQTGVTGLTIAKPETCHVQYPKLPFLSSSTPPPTHYCCIIASKYTVTGRQSFTAVKHVFIGIRKGTVQQQRWLSRLHFLFQERQSFRNKLFLEPIKKNASIHASFWLYGTGRLHAYATE
jgi:hypothetical protein